MTRHFTGTAERWERIGWKDESADDCHKTCRDGADVVFFSRHGEWSSVADSRQTCTTDDQRW